LALKKERKELAGERQFASWHFSSLFGQVPHEKPRAGKTFLVEHQRSSSGRSGWRRGDCQPPHCPFLDGERKPTKGMDVSVIEAKATLLFGL